MCAPLFAPEVAREALGLPEGWEPQGLIVLGEPDEAPASRGRRSVEDVTLWR
jgi:nitroreductase